MGNVLGCISDAEGKAAKCGKAVAPVSLDEIETALLNARQEISTKSFLDKYKIGKIVGHGAFAKVMVCTNKATGEQFAVKSVQKSVDDVDIQREGIIKEVAIMRMLQSHPNAVTLQEVYESPDAYHLVMELCTGGELFDRIISKGHFSEKEASEKMRSLLDFIAFAHSKQIIHRDLKPENILMADETPEAVLKVIDFGTSDFCRTGERLSQKFGTPYYVAPEVLRKCYDVSADVWSAGVIMYILLCGYPPFGGKSDSRILAKVSLGQYSFASKEWEVVTAAAKEMIGRMLVMDTSLRATAAELLTHAWFRVAAAAPAATLGLHMVKRLQAFAGMSRMKRLALVVLARTLTDKDVARLRELFVAMDKNGDGRIDADDLQQALEQVGAATDPEEMRELFSASDIDGEGQIEYEAFIAAMLDTNRVAKRKEVVRRSFEQLDRDGDGYITVEDLAEVLDDEHQAKQQQQQASLHGGCAMGMASPRGSCGGMRRGGTTRGSLDLAARMVKEVDADNDGKVCFEEFRAMMQSGN